VEGEREGAWEVEEKGNRHHRRACPEADPLCARAQARFSCEFSTLCFGEHKFVANESTKLIAEMSKNHFMLIKMKFDALFML
jgi:hypothetical protein